MHKFRHKLLALLLWQFLLELLAQPNEFDGIIRYTDRKRCGFIIVSTLKLAKKCACLSLRGVNHLFRARRWGRYKLNNTMTYAKMGHSMREYTRQGILKKGKKHCRW